MTLWSLFVFVFFAAITFNVNLYLIDDNLAGITLRFIAGATGNYVIYYVDKENDFSVAEGKDRVDWNVYA